MNFSFASQRAIVVSCLLALASLGTVLTARGDEPSRWTLPLVGVGETAAEHVASANRYYAASHAAVAGCGARMARRTSAAL